MTSEERQNFKMHILAADQNLTVALRAVADAASPLLHDADGSGLAKAAEQIVKTMVAFNGITSLLEGIPQDNKNGIRPIETGERFFLVQYGESTGNPQVFRLNPDGLLNIQYHSLTPEAIIERGGTVTEVMLVPVEEVERCE